MLNPFATPAMAAGYARSRLEIARPLDRALDVGCGAGLSTRPLLSIARHCIG
ncbi:MAG: SAM-dependent methyltransferase, partial [Acidobacteria bacterium]|nr:SAM-dependent methyltransferase [Acidobacteriota bacterium]